MVMMRDKMVNGGDDEEADEYADDVDGVDDVGSCYAAVQYWLCVTFARGCWSVMVFKKRMSGSVMVCMVFNKMMREKEMVLMKKMMYMVVVMNMVWLHDGNVVIVTPSPSRGRL